MNGCYSCTTMIGAFIKGCGFGLAQTGHLTHFSVFRAQTITQNATWDVYGPINSCLYLLLIICNTEEENSALTSALSVCKHKVDFPLSSLISEIIPVRVWQIHQNKHSQSFQTSITAVFSPWEPDPNPEAKQMIPQPKVSCLSIFFSFFMEKIQIRLN